MLTRLGEVRSFALPALLVAACLPAYSSVNFGPVGLASNRSNTVTLTIPAATTLTSIAVRTQGAAGLDFADAGGGTCATGTAYAANAKCTVQVSFAPLSTGNRYGAVVLSDSSGVIASVYLWGIGIGPQSILSPGTATIDNFGFQFPQGIGVDGGGNVFVADQGMGWDGIGDWAIDPSVYVFSPSQGMYNQNPGTVGSGLGDPDGIAVDGAGNLYISDLGFYYVGVYSPPYVIPGAVYKETLQTGGWYTQSLVGGFVGPAGLAVDQNGNVYVADSGNCQSCTSGGSNLAGGVYEMEPQPDGSYKQKGIGQAWASPHGVAVDAGGNVYVAEWASQAKGVRGGPAVFKETLQASGSYVQTPISSGWGQPSSIAVDASGSVFVLDGAIWRESLNANGSYSEALVDASAYWPTGFAMTEAGNFFVSDVGQSPPGAGTFDYINLNKPPAFSFPATPEGLSSSAQTASIFNIGNASLTFSEVSYPAGFGASASVADSCTSGTALAAGGSCLLPIEFQPSEKLSSGSLLFSGNVTATTDSLGAPSENQIPVRGREIPPQTPAPLFSLKAGIYGKPQELKITDSMAGASIHYALHGVIPNEASPLYSGPIAVASNETVKAIAIAPGHSASPVVSAKYSIETAAPSFSPKGASYVAAQSVKIIDATPGAIIYYTLKPDQPTSAWTRYDDRPIKITKTATIKAYALASGHLPSAISTAAYKIK
jgi:large repetitive protein